jgi:hypothetical protein
LGQPYRDFLEDPSEIGESWLPPKKAFTTMGRGAFSRQLPEATRNVYERELPKLKPGTLPAPVRTGMKKAASDLTLFVATNSHPKIDPAKGLALIPLVQDLMLPSHSNLSSGIMLYGSSTREEHLNPADSDLILNSLVHVPDSVSSYEEAKKYAHDVFNREVIGHYAELAKEGKISFSELRLGSDKTLGHPEKPENGPFVSYETNPYLSQEDILRGDYRDPKTGKLWTLQELSELGDFSKAKFELYSKDLNSGLKRQEVSLQFLTGFDWKGQTYFLRTNGLKGAPSSLLTTGIYYGAESYATAASMSRTVDYYVSQRGPMLGRAIGELLHTGYDFDTSPPNVLSEPLWKTKFIKGFYSYLVLLRRSGLRLDELFFEDAKKIMQREGIWDDSITFQKFVDEILKDFNKPEVKLISRIKRIANDFAEFHERGQIAQENQIKVRLQELLRPEGDFAKLRSLLRTSGIKLPGETLRGLGQFEATIRELAKAPNSEAFARLGESGAYKNGEAALTSIDVHFNTDLAASVHLSPSSRNLIRVMTTLSPHMYTEYLESRFQTTDEDLKLVHELMGIKGTEQNAITMRELNGLIKTGTLSEISTYQKRLFNSGRTSNPCFAGIKNALQFELAKAGTQLH